MLRTLAPFAPLVAFAIAISALVGSLYAQHIGLEPCVLCWWQRVFMYPLVILIPIGLWLNNRTLVWYAVPLALAGALVALYHTLLYYGIVSEALAPCAINTPCTAPLPALFGVNLVTASLASFILISVLLTVDYRFKP